MVSVVRVRRQVDLTLVRTAWAEHGVVPRWVFDPEPMLVKRREHSFKLLLLMPLPVAQVSPPTEILRIGIPHSRLQPKKTDKLLT